MTGRFEKRFTQKPKIVGQKLMKTTNSIDANKLFSLMSSKGSQQQYIFKVCSQAPKIELLSCVPDDEFDLNDSNDTLETPILTTNNIIELPNGVKNKRLKLSTDGPISCTPSNIETDLENSHPTEYPSLEESEPSAFNNTVQDLREPDISSEVTQENQQSIRDILQRFIDAQAQQTQQLISHFDNGMKKLNTRIKHIENEVTEMKTLMLNKLSDEEVGNVVTYNMFCQTFPNYRLPLKTVKDFTNFNNQISNNTEDLENILKQYFFSNVNYLEDLNSNVTKLIKNFISRDILIQYTAQRQKLGKLVFKDTPFYKLMEDSIIQIYNSNGKIITDKTVIQATGTTISNSKDWDGHRLERMKANASMSMNDQISTYVQDSN